MAEPSFLEAGRGDALVLVHGFLGGASQWRGQMETLSARRRVIAPDLPGFGDDAESAPIPSIPDLAGFLLGFLKDLDVPRFALLGHSMGGMLAQEMALQAPERVTAVMLCCTGAMGEMPGRFESIAESRARAEQEGAEASAARIAATWLTGGAESPFFPEIFRIARQAKLPAHLAGLGAMEQWNGMSRLPDIAAPALVLWSSRDRSYPFERAHELWHGIPNADLAVIPGAAHAAPIEKSELFNALVEDFLQTLTAGGI